MNWGYRIILVFIVFAAGILTLVAKSMCTHIDMVTSDYYGEELKYQHVIDGRKNAAGLSVPISIQQTPTGILVVLPPELHGMLITGKLTFYRPSDSGKDILLPLQPDENGRQLIKRLLFIKGRYKATVEWQMNNQPFYQEQPLNIF
ncbi:FixH family protein [Chitinophaga sp. 30R24]|uniref:FixH family protein n=1 Tax=Chitinophaga sp. 30R24 TaxID=3248838 RepID=UPI003B91F991